MKVLVSGIGGDIGLGIARILKGWGVFSHIYGIDIHSDHPGSLIVDQCAVAPKADDESYILWLSTYITDNEIDVFIPSSESEINALVTLRLDRIAGAKIIKNNELTIQKSLDKYECLSYLSSCGIPVPTHGLVGSTFPSNYPVIAKPRSGQGSKGITLVRNVEELKSCQSGWVWQSYLSPDDQEYTCAVYGTPRNDMHVLVIKRKLVHGMTGSGVVVANQEIERYVRLIAEAMQLDGAINIQLRLTKSGPLLFEINPRLSSTLVFRDKMGFADLRWWVAAKLGLDSPPFMMPKAGTHFYRGSQEYISTF
ncbi:carbamoyl-phosphate synthase large subunit [Vreelandella subterranea]|uniref:Carbamoyl-phosphate synthase large subunit n=1 Tax=Vreelandella subterranea TaxID=416874 RepID=A0A1H9WL80_9GAMM|nr:ATP-grasp domain-containing protein [Halomonas subterranea]SES34672.1 carbamoyl-phosphate synthase large subunit [Halomonas subterranea]